MDRAAMEGTHGLCFAALQKRCKKKYKGDTVTRFCTLQVRGPRTQDFDLQARGWGGGGALFKNANGRASKHWHWDSNDKRLKRQICKVGGRTLGESSRSIDPMFSLWAYVKVINSIKMAPTVERDSQSFWSVSLHPPQVYSNITTPTIPSSLHCTGIQCPLSTSGTCLNVITSSCMPMSRGERTKPEPASLRHQVMSKPFGRSRCKKKDIQKDTYKDKDIKTFAV
jgi:hypothetical protein